MRRRAVWGTLAIVVAVACVAFVVLSARRLGAQRPPTGPLAEALADRVVTLMETRFRSVTSGGPEPVVCAARPFGVRPDGLDRPDRATTIYAWVHCRSADPPGAGAELLSPVALRLDGGPTLRVPEQGPGRDRSIQRIFPADVRAALTAVDPARLRAVVAAKLDARRRASAG